MHRLNNFLPDEPDPCGKPDILDWGPSHADLAWDPPAFDGGAPITHYIIEQKEENMGQWVEGKVLTVKEVEAMGNKIKGKIDGLVEGCEYKFRIRAVNKGGPSKPGPPSDSMIAKHRFIPPHLLGDGIYDITLKKGRPIRSVLSSRCFIVWPALFSFHKLFTTFSDTTFGSEVSPHPRVSGSRTGGL